MVCESSAYEKKNVSPRVRIYEFHSNDKTTTECVYAGDSASDTIT